MAHVCHTCEEEGQDSALHVCRDFSGKPSSDMLACHHECVQKSDLVLILNLMLMNDFRVYEGV